MTRAEGSLTVELVVLVPVVALLGLVGLGLGRYEIVRAQILDAAHAGAEAASIAPTATEASSDAAAAVAPTLQSDRRACPDPAVSTSTAGFQRGGSVAVSVTCTVPVSDLTFILPGSLTVSGSSSEPIDPYRSVG